MEVIDKLQVIDKPQKQEGCRVGGFICDAAGILKHAYRDINRARLILENSLC